MEKKNKLVLIVIIALTICVVGLCIYSIISNKNSENSDAIKFRNEYMELNDKVNSINGKSYVNVSLSEKNTVKYVTEEEAVELLKQGTGVIYFGFSTCPWCRSLVSILASVAEDKNETVYYLDVLDIRSSFKLENGALNKLKDGSKGYYQILDLLDDELEDFYLTDEAGNQIHTNEKRLYAPTLVAVKDGKVTAFHVGTVESQESGYDKLTNEQTKELEDIVKKLIDSKNTEICTQDKC